MKFSFLLKSALYLSIILGVQGIQAQKSAKTTSFMIPGEIIGFSQPESLSQKGNNLYVANVKNGKGYISKVNLLTNTIEEVNFLPTGTDILKSQGPLGIKVHENTLYAVAYDRVVGFDLDSRKMIFEITIPGSTRLNDLTFANGSLLVSGTDKGMIYEIDIAGKTFKPFVTDPTDAAMLNGVSGLTWNGATGTVYATANKNNASPSNLLAIDWKSRKLNLIYQMNCTDLCFFDAIQCDDKMIYFTNWNHNVHAIPFPIKPISENTITNLQLKGLTKVSAYDGPPAFLISEDKSCYIFTLFESGKVIIEKIKS
ncbi:YncE family protein [Flavobacterium sp. '19STA2R22 D10 B1']|uniref:YncE family protein n=1 Tax=Flavobacterium aerium TaxID=3037261 RepID=UPI00278C3797|nr:hypothetical protein [Flavobacterium sp. '19STA2R22 D10 B1']